MPYLREIATLCAFKKKPVGFEWVLLKKWGGGVFHLEMVVILAMSIYHQGALEPFTLTHGIKACCGSAQVLWRSLDTMSLQIKAHLYHTSPTAAIGACSLPLSSAFHAANPSKENWLKALLNDFLLRAIISQ